MRIFEVFVIVLCALHVESGGFFKKIGNIFSTKEGSEEDSGEATDAQVESAYQFGSLLIKPALNFILGGSDGENQPQSVSVTQETTTPYNYGNYAYSPGYYADSLVQCPAKVLKGRTITVTCKRDGFTAPCDGYIFAKDVAEIQCNSGYEYPKVTGIRTRIECMQNGKWSAPIFECVPVCGRVTKRAKALVIHGAETEASEFPWNVAIYLSGVLVCGGNILTERVILSAAHCFVRETPHGIERYPQEKYEIVAGKYFRDPNAAESSPTQSFKVEKVQIHDAYYGFLGNYDADIAIVTLDSLIVYQPHIAPVCLNLDLKTLAEKQVPLHEMGIVVGYGYTEADGAPSDRLKKIELPIVDIRECKREAPDSFKPFVTSDKFCAGFNDGRGGVCKGDSGAGYVIGKVVGDETIYYLHGIVSNTRAVRGGCDLNFYAMFTHVQNYIDMIKEEIRLSQNDH